MLKKEKHFQPHGNGGGQNHGDHAGAHAGQKRLHSGVLEKIADQRRNHQNDDKRGQHNAQRRRQRAEKARLRGAYEGGGVHGDGAGRGFRYGDQVQKFFFRQPAVAENRSKYG